MERSCLFCDKEVEGRVDKLYCTAYCKTSFHYVKNKSKERSRFQKIDDQLKRNRSILKHFHKTGLTTILKEELLTKGFNPNYFTNYWKNNKKEVYLFCYEYGFLSLKQQSKEKYVIIDWQEYMTKS